MSSYRVLRVIRSTGPQSTCQLPARPRETWLPPVNERVVCKIRKEGRHACHGCPRRKRAPSVPSSLLGKGRRKVWHCFLLEEEGHLACHDFLLGEGCAADACNFLLHPKNTKGIRNNMVNNLYRIARC